MFLHIIYFFPYNVSILFRENVMDELVVQGEISAKIVTLCGKQVMGFLKWQHFETYTKTTNPEKSYSTKG